MLESQGPINQAEKRYMPINQAEKAFFASLKDNKPGIGGPPTLDQQRATAKILFTKHAGQAAKAPFRDILIPTRDGQNVRVRIFNPTIEGPVLFFLPGNAFIFDLFECNAIAASRIAFFGKLKVIMIDYRLMPENPWPTTINDIEDVMTEIWQNPTKYAIDQEFIYLSGICSGAHAAALVALKKNRAFILQKLILLNGLYDQSLSQNNYAAFEREDEMVIRSSFFWWFNHYKISSEEAKAPDRSPLYAEDFSALPKTALIISEYDGFRSDSEAFYLKLQEHHIPVSKTVIQGQTHNTMILRGAMHDGPDPAEILANAVNC